MPFMPIAVVNTGSQIPTEPVTGMLAWYDAADTATLTIVSNKVSQWNDKSGNGQFSLHSESTTFTGGLTLRIGAHFSGEFADGLIAEVILYDSTLSDADLNSVGSYLQGKWGFPW
jgi:hypothetical protein